MSNKLLDPIFLSASIPDREPYVQTSDPLLIREAILALVSVSIRTRNMVFGGHPAISPLIEHASRSLGAQENVYIYQSRWFENQIPEVAKSFRNIIWTERKSTRESSLRLMREEMITSNSFAMAIFIGGMEGVEEECEIFKKFHMKKPTFPIASTKGAALILFEKNEGPQDEKLRQQLISNYHYRSMLKQILKNF